MGRFMDGWMGSRFMDGWGDGWMMDGQQVHGWVARKNGWVTFFFFFRWMGDGWVDSRMDGWKGGCVDSWMDG